MAMTTTLKLGELQAILFDLDGVLTPTVDLHKKAWQSVFEIQLPKLASLTNADADATGGVTQDPVRPRPYTEQDYLEHVDGKPRFDGVASVLASRGMSLPWGDPTDQPGIQSVCALGNLKNEVFSYLLENRGIEPYQGSLQLLQSLNTTHPQIKLAVVSSSKNAQKVLQKAGLAEYFSVVVDGIVAAAEGISGKPAPDTYLYAARQLGADPALTAVIEDAISGVQSGEAGGFGLVVGVNRGSADNARTMLDNGADMVVTDLAELN